MTQVHSKVVLLSLALAASLLISACAGKPSPPGFLSAAQTAMARGSQAYLEGDSRRSAIEYQRAIQLLSQTGRAELIAKAVLTECAAAVAGLNFQRCTAFDALAQDASEADQDDGWTHHFLYIGVCLYLLHNGLTSLFAVALVEELPIVLLSMYEVRNKQKPSLLFGMLYFFTRIMFHTALIYKAAAISNVIFAVGLNLLLLHVREFQRWVRGYLMRSHNRKRMNFRVKLGMFFAMLASYVALQGYAAYDLVFNEYPQPPSAPIVAIHSAIFLFFMYRFGIVVHDVYTQNFIMTSIGRKKIIYNISWEDPAVDHKVMHMTDQDVVLTISSAGCNVLDYLCEGPKKIIAVDMNAAQLHTLELKLACIRALDWETFFAIWGRSDYKVFKSVYATKLSRC